MASAGLIPPHKVRAPAVAGRFYPADPEELRGLVNALLAAAPPAPGPAPKAIIAPHAGYPYSGPIAASAYARLAPARDLIRRVVLLGPAHYVRLKGLAVPGAEAFATPLGLVPLDLESIGRLRSLPQVQVSDEAHAQEHSLEVQLPFLQTVLGSFSLVPLAVGDAAPEEVAEVFDLLWGGPETRFVVSSDLSHDHDIESARGLDCATARAIEALDPAGIGESGACGRIPIRGLLQTARSHRLRAQTVDLRTSGDTAGFTHRIVGYGAFTFEE